MFQFRFLLHLFSVGVVYCVGLCVHVCLWVCASACRSERMAWWSQFSPSTWALGVELGFLGLEAIAFPSWAIHHAGPIVVLETRSCVSQTDLTLSVWQRMALNSSSPVSSWVLGLQVLHSTVYKVLGTRGIMNARHTLFSWATLWLSTNGFRSCWPRLALHLWQSSILASPGLGL